MAEQEIADQDARLIAPDEAGGFAAAPVVAFVDDIVMEQGSGVHKLDGGGEADVGLALIADQLGGGDGQHRPQPFTTGINQMVSEFRDHLDIGYGLVENDAIDGTHVLAHQFENWLEAVGGVSCSVELYYDAHGMTSDRVPVFLSGPLY